MSLFSGCRWAIIVLDIRYQVQHLSHQSTLDTVKLFKLLCNQQRYLLKLHFEIVGFFLLAIKKPIITMPIKLQDYI